VARSGSHHTARSSYEQGISVDSINQFCTIQEAADRLSVSTKSIRRWIASGELRGVRVGATMIRVDVESINKFVRPLAGTVAA
jgi:excisionase family DNA binding protein